MAPPRWARSPPDPNRPIDPAHHMRGVIKVAAEGRRPRQGGGAIFLIVKQADASGQPTGTPLAVDKLTWGGKDPRRSSSPKARP